ncbi:ABC-2 transporter permease [Staphylococcus pseudintermedius]|uniref:ABC-2 transporter permease n=1 Tax=Staphylococcus pseudintermedius TaxID=283734 RepID=UPI002ED8B88E
MKGLLLAQYYSNFKNFYIYLMTGIILSIFLILANFPNNKYLATILILAFVTSTALDFLKQEEKVGWDKFQNTLPISTNKIVQSHALFYLFTVSISIFVSFVLLFITKTNIIEIISITMVTFSIALQLYIYYLLTYILSSERSSIIQFISFIFISFSYILFNTISLVIGASIFGNGNNAIENSLFLLVRSFIYMLISFIFFIIIYKLNILIRKSKEY